MNFLCGLFYLLMLFLLVACDPSEWCDLSEQRRCRRGLVAELDQKTAKSGQMLEQSCRKMEADLNCLALYVTRCPTPNRSGDLLNRSQSFLQEHCEQFGGWWSYDCFHLDEMKKCEKIFALENSKSDRLTCRDFDRFRHCISDVVRKQCDPEDESFIGTYLLDGAGELLWTCPPAKGHDPAVREGFVGVDGRKGAIVLSAAASDKRRGGPSGVASHLSVGTHPKKQGLPMDLAQESHLRNVYTSSLTGEGPFVSGCGARATEEMRGCLDRHQYERDKALGAREDEDRLRKECCATWNYRRCLQKAVRIHCYDTQEVDLQSVIDVVPHDRGFLCRNHWIYSCSGASSPFPINFHTFLLLALLAIFAFWRRPL